MRKSLVALLASGLLVSGYSIPADSQTNTTIFAVPTASCGAGSLTAGPPVPVTQDLTGALCTNATGGSSSGGTSAATVATTLPTIATATALPVQSKGGGTYVQPVFGSAAGGGTIVDSSKGLPVAFATTLPAFAATPTVNVGTTSGTVPANILQVNGASIGTGVPIWATSLNVNSGNVDGTSKTGLQYSGVAGVAETSATSCTTATQCYVSLDPNNRALRIDNAPVTAGGLSLSSQYLPASVAALAIDASPGQLYKIEVFNNNATILYLNYFDSASGSTNCASSSTAKLHVGIPANSTSGAGWISSDVFGLPFATAITQCAGIIYGGTGLPTADEYIVNVYYK